MELTRLSFAQRLARLGPTPPASRTSAPAPLSAFDVAIEHFAASRWAEAFEALVPLADAGHPQAARIALMMATRGPRLFGQSFEASPTQRERWGVANESSERRGRTGRA